MLRGLFIKDEERIKSVLRDFHVKTENDFYLFINKNWNLCKCIKCRKIVNLLTCDFYNGDPCCKNGCLS